MREVNNMEDILDSRDVIARRDELKEEREAIYCCAEFSTGSRVHDEECGAEAKDAAKRELKQWDEDYGDELRALEAFIAEGSPSWEDGETLIRESYFEDYAQELADDIGAIPRDVAWPYTCIDWERAARELQYDYTGADFDGVTYYYRA